MFSTSAAGTDYPTLATLVVLFLFALVPPIVFVIWIRNTERWQREPWRSVFWLFLFGMIFAIIIAIVLEGLAIRAGDFFQQESVALGQALQRNPSLGIIILAVVVAPIMEELAKGLGVYTIRRQIREPEDGLVFGAASGLGFAATENFFYGVVAYISAPDASTALVSSLVVIGIRSFSSALLHASAAGTFGFGIARHHLRWGSALPYYLMAVAMHGTFNFLASFGEIFKGSYGDWAEIFGLAAAVLFAIAAIALIRGTIRHLERPTRPLY